MITFGTFHNIVGFALSLSSFLLVVLEQPSRVWVGLIAILAVTFAALSAYAVYKTAKIRSLIKLTKEAILRVVSEGAASFDEIYADIGYSFHDWEVVERAFDELAWEKRLLSRVAEAETEEGRTLRVRVYQKSDT